MRMASIFSAAMGRAGDGDSGAMRKVGRGRWFGGFVGQDKGNVTLRYWPRFSRSDSLLPARNECVTRRALYNVMRVTRCNALARTGEASFQTWRRRLFGPLAGLGITAISAALLSIAGCIFHLRITLTDSAAAPGVYRVADSPGGRGDLVAACLPAAVARTGLARGYLQRGDCPAGAEPVAKVIGAVAGIVLIALRKREWSARMPYGPYIAVAAVIWIFGGYRWLKIFF